MDRLLVAFVFLLAQGCFDAAPVLEEELNLNEEWPLYRNDCFIAFLEDNVGQDKQEIYDKVDREAAGGLNVTRMFEFENIEPGFVFMGDKDSAAEIAKMEGVQRVIPDYMFIGQQQSARGIQWHLDRSDQHCLPLDNSYSPYGNGSGVDIYILDSGANFNHSDIKDKLVFPGRDMIDEHAHTNLQGSDCHGHGTHVAGLAVGDKFGVAPGATVIVVRVLDCHNFGPYSAVMSGIDFTAEQIKKRKRKAVVSMSLLGFADPSFDRAVGKLISLGVPVVVAAGNYKMSSCNYSPSRMSQVITVAATQQEDDGLYWFSSRVNSPGTNYGSCVDIFAPGQWVNSAGHKCTDCMMSRSGTSMATPMVSGVVALLLEKYPNDSAVETKARLLAMSTKGVVNFKSFTNATDIGEAMKTPNRLLYVPRNDDMVVDCPPTTSQAKTAMPIQATSTEDQITKSTPLPPPIPKPPAVATVSKGTTAPQTTQSPTTSATEPLTASTLLPTTTTPTTPPPSVVTPESGQLQGTIFKKMGPPRCYGRLLDAAKAVIYTDIPHDRARDYRSTWRDLGYDLTWIVSMRREWNVESTFILCFAQKERVPTYSIIADTYVSVRVGALRYASRGYYPRGIVHSMYIDETGSSELKYSTILYKDVNYRGAQITSRSSHFDAHSYTSARNGSHTYKNFHIRQISSISLNRDNLGVKYLFIAEMKSSWTLFNFMCDTIEEVRAVVNMMHNKGYSLEDFDSHWSSPVSMKYNLVFSNEPKETCSYLMIMDMNGTELTANNNILSRSGWSLWLVNTHLRSRFLKFIAVWWK